MGGVSATCDAAGACDEAVREVRARAAIESKVETRIVDPHENDFRRDFMPLT
jgi:hypothetical protein